MRVRFNCNSGANIHSNNSEVIDLVEDWGYEEGDWENMSEDDKYKEVEDWAYNSGLELWWEEVDD